MGQKEAEESTTSTAFPVGRRLTVGSDRFPGVQPPRSLVLASIQQKLEVGPSVGSERVEAGSKTTHSKGQ